MENIFNHTFNLAIIISFVYFLFKFIEMRFITKQIKPLKELIRETIFVYIVSLFSLFISNQLNFINISQNTSPKLNVFVDNPNF